jgi:predicted alpha/beta superfamily hydrolase
MPLIQNQFRVTHTRETTGIMGSSLGALISLYAFFQHPE